MAQEPFDYPKLAIGRMAKDFLGCVWKGLGCIGVVVFGVPLLLIVLYFCRQFYDELYAQWCIRDVHVVTAMAAPHKQYCVQENFNSSFMVEEMRIKLYPSPDDSIRVMQGSTNRDVQSALGVALIGDTLLLYPGPQTRILDDDGFPGHDGVRQLYMYLPRNKRFSFQNGLYEAVQNGSLFSQVDWKAGCTGYCGYVFYNEDGQLVGDCVDGQ